MVQIENMKSDAFDTTYKKYNRDEPDSCEKVQSKKVVTSSQIEVLIKALGTMVIINKERLNPITMQIEDNGPTQEPILLGKQREIVLNRLVELIENL